MELARYSSSEHPNEASPDTTDRGVTFWAATVSTLVDPSVACSHMRTGQQYADIRWNVTKQQHHVKRNRQLASHPARCCSPLGEPPQLPDQERSQQIRGLLAVATIQT